MLESEPGEWVRYADVFQEPAPLASDTGVVTDAMAGLLKAAKNIMLYLRYTIGEESPGHHPTMPSAVGAFAVALEAAASAQETGVVTDETLRVLIRETIDKGLIYWEPNTERGYVRKAELIARLEAALSASSHPQATSDTGLARLRERIWQEREKHGDDLVALSPAFDLILNWIDEDVPAAPQAVEAAPVAFVNARQLEHILSIGGGTVYVAPNEIGGSSDLTSRLYASPAPTPQPVNAELLEALGNLISAFSGSPSTSLTIAPRYVFDADAQRRYLNPLRAIRSALTNATALMGGE